MASRALLATAAAAVAAAQSVPAITPGSDIPAVVVDESSVTVSGISSGAFMAVQMHVAFSLTIKGAGALAGGPYWCAQDDVVVALGPCMTSPAEIDVDYLYGILQNTALWGFVDPLDGLAQARVWMLSAQNDTVVATGVVQANQALYSMLLAHPASQLHADYGHQGEHSQITASYGNPCTFLGSPYINDCGFDAAGDMLQWLYNGALTPPTNATAATAAAGAEVAATSADASGVAGNLICRFARAVNATQPPIPADVTFASLPVCEEMPVDLPDGGVTTAAAAYPPAPSKGGAASPSLPVLRSSTGTLYEFDQGAFVGGGGWDSAWGLAQSAFVYIPDACLQGAGGNGSSGSGGAPAGGCILHSAFHGCEQTQDDIGKAFILDGGYLPWADANSMVVVFPQAISNLLNPKGCWDWWSFTGSQYASNIGTQTLAMKRVLDVLMSHPITPNRTELVGAEVAQAQWEATHMHAHSLARARGNTQAAIASIELA